MAGNRSAFVVKKSHRTAIVPTEYLNNTYTAEEITAITRTGKSDGIVAQTKQQTNQRSSGPKSDESANLVSASQLKEALGGQTKLMEKMFKKTKKHYSKRRRGKQDRWNDEPSGSDTDSDPSPANSDGDD